MERHAVTGTELPASAPAEARYPDLAGKVAVVTGASRGIGAGAAQALAANGAQVALVGRDSSALASVAQSITSRGGRAAALRADCTREEEMHRLARDVAEQLGPVAILAAYAGGNGMPVPTEQEIAGHWREVIDTDLTSTFVTVSAFLPALIDRGGGSVITMSSAAARQAARSSAAYAAAKAGVIGFSRHLAGELAPHGIRVNCLAPSAIENDRMRNWMTPEQRQQLAESFPLRRLGQPHDTAAATLFFASDASSWITGVTLDVAGGKIML